MPQIYTNKRSRKVGFGLLVSFVVRLVFFVNIAHATCIIIHIGKGEIFIGADSRSVHKAFNADSVQYLRTCKIARFDSTFFVMSGLTNSDSYNFNPYQIAEAHFSSSESFNSKLSNFVMDIKTRLSEILKKIRTNRRSWQMVVTKENRILDVALIGEINGQFGVYRLGFVLTETANMTIDVQQEMIPCNESTDKYIGFGESDEGKKYIVANVKSETPERLIPNAIKAQSIMTPAQVGEPVNLLRVTADSFQWLLNCCCDK